MKTLRKSKCNSSRYDQVLKETTYDIRNPGILEIGDVMKEDTFHSTPERYSFSFKISKPRIIGS
jgi:hypothetical protein